MYILAITGCQGLKFCGQVAGQAAQIFSGWRQPGSVFERLQDMAIFDLTGAQVNY
jgi:hypothetical protein